jgi:hypothetical protein
VIRDGNKTKSWPKDMEDFSNPDAAKEGGKLPKVQLLQDCET